MSIAGLRRPFASWGIVAAVLVSVLAPSGAASAYQRPGRTERISVAANGGQLGRDSSAPSISRDGRYAAFSTNDLGVVPGDDNGGFDVFLRDRWQGTTERVSVASDGSGGNADSFQPAVSATGRYVAFFGGASNLVDGDTNEKADTFVHDRVTGETERVSVASDGTQGNDHSWDAPAITPDGRYVAFRSFASNLVPGDTNGTFDVFVHDRETRQTERVSVATDGMQANGLTWHFAISDDGRYVAFESFASSLVLGDLNLQPDLFLRDRQAGTTERVSVSSTGAEGNGGSYSAAISGNGRYVAFESYASNLVPGDMNGFRDVFVRELQTGAVERVSLSSAGLEAAGGSSEPRLSADGRHVAFYSFANNLAPGDSGTTADIFVRDRLIGATERVSLAFDGSSPDRSSSQPVLDASGRWVAFLSSARNLLADDTNSVYDVFVRDRGPALGVGGLQASGGVEPSVSGWASFTGAVVSSAEDAGDDAGPGGSQAGADLTGATVVHRPEQEDLFLRLSITELPGVQAGAAGLVMLPGVAGGPGVLYGMELQAGGVRYEVRALRAGATANLPAAPYFALFRCNPTCTEVSRLSGGFGTAGDEIMVSVPLSDLGPGEIPVTGLRAFTALGEASPGTVRALDEISLPDATLRPPTVVLGIAPAGTPEDEVTFDTPAELVGGAFSNTLDASALAAGDHDVWARACLGDACSATSVRMTL